MKAKLLCFTATAALLIAVAAGAAEVSTDQGESTRTSKEQSLNSRKSKEKRKSTSTRKSTSSSTGRDRTATDSAKRAASIDRGHSLDATLPAAALFLPTAPVPTALLPADVGLSGVKGGWVDTTMQDAIAAAAKGNAPLSAVGGDENRVKQYISELLRAGGVLGQATLYLQRDAAAVGQLGKAKTGEIEVRGLGADDLQRLAEGALRQAGESIADPRISSVLRSTPLGACRFVGDPSVIACGRAVVTLTDPPTLKVAGGVPWFDADKGFAGVSGTFRVSSSWSLNQALEALKSDSRYAKVAAEASKAAEELEARGQTVEAAMSRRKALEQSSGSKASMAPSRYIPGINQ